MKKLLSILSICLVLISCTSDRVFYDKLTNHGTETNPVMYIESDAFNGVAFDIHSNGQLKYEENYKDGKPDGLSQRWYENGQLKSEMNFRDGKPDGLVKWWYSNGQLKSEESYKDDELDGSVKMWDENGKLEYHDNYEDGVKQ